MNNHLPDFAVNDFSQWPVMMTLLDVGHATRMDEKHSEPSSVVAAVQHLKRKRGLKAVPGFTPTMFYRDDVLTFMSGGGSTEGAES